MNKDIINGFARRKGMRWFTLVASLFFLTALSEATAYEGEYDRSFYASETYDYWDTNTLDGVADGNPNVPGVQTTLRAALMEAEAQGGTTLITLGAGAYENTISQQFINANVIIEGRGSGKTILEGNHLSRVISVGDIYDRTNYTVIIIGVTIQNGAMSDDRLWGGGGIKNFWSTVTLKDVVITGCAAGGQTQCLYGGGIHNVATMTLENCTVTKNHANGTGGAIYSHGTLAIINSTISDNTAANGAGIDNHIGNITIAGSTISDNRAAGFGGGILNNAGDSLTNIVNSTISGNSAGTTGGGIHNEWGGGTLTNVTVAYNVAGVAGGGIYQKTSQPAYHGATLKNTILAHNTAGDCAGALNNIKDEGGNVCTGSSCGLPVGDPLLGPLQDNGGLTFTHALLRGSAAIDAGNNSVCPDTDQRGVARPQDGDGDTVAVCDIGAFECEGIPPLPYSDISLSPGSHDFGKVLVAQSSTALEIAISNSGPLNLVVSGMTLSDTTNYSLDPNGGSNPCGSTAPTIPTGQSRTLTVTFAPSAVGTFDADLTINSDDPDEPSVVVSLTGKGGLPEPEIALAPSVADFGEVLVGFLSDQIVTVSNEGTDDLTIGTIGGADSLDPPFSIVNDGCSGQTLSPEESCTLTVRFAPTEEGEFNDTFDIPSNDPDENPFTVNISGEGVTPGLASKLQSNVHDGGNGHDSTWGVAIDGQGNLVVAGYVKGATSPDYGDTAYLTKYDPDGIAFWTETMEVGAIEGQKLDSTDRFYDAAVDSENNIIVVGVKSGTWETLGYHQAMLTRKYGPDGTLIWEKTHHDFAWSSAWGVAIDGDDNIYVTGNVFTSWTIANQWAVLKYDKNGNLQSGFPVHYNFSNSNDFTDVPYDIAVDRDGNFIVVGERGVANGNLDWHVRKYDSDRVLVWEDTYDGASLYDYAHGVTVDSNGDVIVVGHTNKGADNSSNANYDWLIIKYAAADGERLWTRSFESAAGRSEACYDVAVDGLDNILAGGYERDGDDVVHWRLELLNGEDGSLLGGQVWVSDNNQNIYGLALRNGKLAIGGYEDNGTDNDMLTFLGEYIAEPDISVSPQWLDFGEIMAGSSLDQTVTVTNNGEGDLTFGDIGSGDPLGEPFSILSDHCSGHTIASGESCTFTVGFAPTEAGEFSDTFDIPSDHPEEDPVLVQVSGTVTPSGAKGKLASELWYETHDGGNGHDYTWGVALDSQGNMVAIGYVRGAASPDYGNTAYIIKYPADGSDPWTDTLEVGPTGGQKADSGDGFYDVAVDSEDNIIVVGAKSGTWTGYSEGSYHNAMLTRKYEPNGTLLWERVYQDGGGSPWNAARGVAIDSDDNVYVTGSVFTSWTIANQWAVLKYDKNGNLQSGFPVHYNFSNSNDFTDVPYDIAVDRDGNFIVVGERGVANGNLDWHVRKYDSDRVLVWEDTYDGANLYDYAWGVAVDSNGDALVVGYTNKGADNSSNANYDWLIIKYRAADGERLWTRTYESAAGRSEACYDVAVDGLDNILAGGYERDGDDVVHWRLELLSGEDGSVIAEQVWESENNQSIYGLAFRNRQIALGGYENNGTDNDMRMSLADPPPMEIEAIYMEAANSITFEWAGAMSKVTILHSPTLFPADWQPIAGPLSGTVQTVEMPPEATSGYYRLMEE